jgi:hypothetical protein
VLPWQNPRWIRAFAAILIIEGAIVFGLVRFAHTSLLWACECLVILTSFGQLVWFSQSKYRGRKALRDVLVVFLGSGIILATLGILYEKSETTVAGLLILVVVLARMIWRRPLLKKLRAENEKEKSV